MSHAEDLTTRTHSDDDPDSDDSPAFDVEGVFDEDYLHFHADRLGDAASDADHAQVRDLLGLAEGARVLDLACGHGRIANRLAAGGCRVTGLDVTPLFLDRARADADARGVDVAYVEGDMRALPWTEEFDAALCWFTSYGYFTDAENRQVLAEVARALRPGGRFLLELNNLAGIMRTWQSSVVVEVGDDLALDQHRFDPLTSRAVTTRTIVRDGRVRRTCFTVRLFAFPELRDWLLDAGFTDVAAYGEDGEPLTAEHRRMRVVAQR